MPDYRENHPDGRQNPENNPEEYKVGRGRPPKQWQWKPGQSGNPSGGRRHSDTEPLSERISNEKIPIYENGRAICLRGLQVLAWRVVNGGIAGDPECENILIKIEQPDLKPPSRGLEFFDVDSDDEIPAIENL